jgi:hypothetical protein
MPGSTSLRLIATRQQRHIVSRLWQLYCHDLSEFRGSMPDSEGLYQPGRLPTFFEDPDRCGYLIYSGKALAGFALIRGLSQELTVVSEFFVVRAARRQRVGHEPPWSFCVSTLDAGGSPSRRKTRVLRVSGDASRPT